MTTPLAQEIQTRQQDVADAQGFVTQLASLAAGAAQALTIAQQFAAGLAGPAQQLTALAQSVHDVPSATQAEQAAQPILASCRAMVSPTPPAVSPLAPAEQTWSAISALATQRGTWLTQRWQRVHQEQPFAGATGMTDPLASALAGYAAATGQLDASMHAAVTTFPVAPSPSVVNFPAGVTAWLTQCALQLTQGHGGITGAELTIGTTMPWTGLQAAAAGAVTAAQGLVDAAQRVAAAVTGATATAATDPATLAARLSDLTALRIEGCPDPVTAADHALYGTRMAELDAALSGLLGGSTGVPASVPLVMPPVSIQVRTRAGANGGTDFRIRVYPDSFHVNAHDPRLTADEAQWAQHLAAAATANGGTLPQAEWAQAAERFGPARAAYLLHPDASAGTRPGPFAQPATATALPDQWLAIGYGPDGVPLAAALGKPIPAALQVPDLSQSPAAATSGEPSVDPAVRWMIDFDEAVANGMGLVLTVDGGAGGTPPAPAKPGGTPTSLPPGTWPATLSRLVVVGVRAAEATATLTGLFGAHHYTDGLELIAYGTPTNNTAAGPSGYTAADPGYARSYAEEVLRPAATGDAARLAAALGVPPSVFAAAATAPLTEQLDQQAMTALAWQATWGGFLTGPAGMGTERADRLRSWAAAWVRPGGPLPTLRVGTRPYGLLPVIDLAQWTADPGDLAAPDVHSVITGLVPAWLAADPSAAGLDFDALLARTPVTTTALARFCGIMPGWLRNDYGLGVGYATLQAAIGALPGQLAQIGPAAGLGPQLAWPGGFVTLPDPVAPASPWPLLNGDGSAFPFSTGPAPAVPATYLGALLSGTQQGNPGALLDFIARQSWAGTSGMPGGQWPFGPRGNLGDQPEPLPPPSAADELHASVSHLAGRAGADFDSLLGGALDITAHRLDAWHTALATRRLGALRAAQPAQVYLGAFGEVENLVARAPLAPASVPDEPAALQDPANLGYQLAPSEQQAVTAAVLRSAFITNNPSYPFNETGQPPANAAQIYPFAIDLSSRRARLATWLLDGARQGQALADLLGYRFERSLQEAEPPLGALIEPFRQAFPRSPVITAGSGNGSGGTPAESAPPSGVTDGVALNDLAATVAPGQQPASLPAPLTAQDWTQAQPALADLADAVDAVADAVTAQSLHHALTGNTYGAGATLDSVASGVVPPPPLSFLNTPRSGSAITHRVLVPVPAGQPSPPPGWPATPRGAAEPALTSWLAGLLGDPSQVTATVTLTDATGKAIAGAPVPVTLAGLGLGPLDVADLAARPAELQDLAVHTVLTAGAGSGAGATGGTLNASPLGAARPLAAALAIAATAGQVMGTGTAADARVLAPPGTVTDPGADLSDLATRVNGSTGGPPGAAGQLTAAAAALAAALPGDPAPGSGTTTPAGVPAGADPAALAAALIRAMLLGVPAAAPAGTGAAALPVLVNQARAARAEIAARQAAVTALAPAAGALPAAQLAARLDQLSAAFGAGFRALPVITTNPAGLLAQAAALTATATADPGQGPDAWIVKASRVHQPLADLLTACCAAEALGSGPPLALTIAQLPVPPPAAPGAAATPAPWAGLPFDAKPPAAGTLSLVMAAAAAPAGSFSALVVTAWDEMIPGKQQIAGLTYHYDAPAAQAPQCVLLAVPAAHGTGTWSYEQVAATVTAAWQVAHIRGVDYADLPEPARVVLPAAYFADAQVAASDPWVPALQAVSVPQNYTKQTPDAAEITSVTPVSLMQGQAVPLTVTGVNFAPSDAPPGTPPLTYQSFAVTTADGSNSGVSLTAGAGTVSDTQAPLLATVATNATPGPRNLTVGGFSLANCLTVVPRPLATGCDTAQLAQRIGLPVTQVITVTGQAFSSPAVTLTGSALVMSCVVTSSTATVLKVTVTIAKATYTGGGFSNLAMRPELPNGGPPPPPPPPPVHVAVNLTLNVTPAPNTPAETFKIVLDSIV
jgi:hypothetical protein